MLNHTLKADESGLRAEIQLLKQTVARLEKKIDAAGGPLWDCYKTQDWTAEDIIEFDYCDINTMTGDPSLGLVAIDVAGTYRLTFMGRIRNTIDVGDGGYVRLKVNNEVVATSGEDDAYDYASLSINVLQELVAGDVVTIEFEGYGGGYLDATSDFGEKFVHWTGQKLA